MSVKKDGGRRSIQVEAEVPGTPEQVWQAIATGPGISSWFVPTEMEGRKGGKVVCNFGPGMDSVSTIIEWDAPRRMLDEGSGMGPDSPPMLTEWTVEARAGGTCVVRVVHSMATTSDAWDKELESVESGWPGFFRILRLYLTHHAGQPCSAIRLFATSSQSEAEAWAALTQSLGITQADAGRTVASPAGAPRLSGISEGPSAGHGHSLLLRMDAPAPGIASISAFPCGGPVMVAATLYFYGAEAAAIAQKETPVWEAWINKLIPAAVA